MTAAPLRTRTRRERRLWLEAFDAGRRAAGGMAWVDDEGVRCFVVTLPPAPRPKRPAPTLRSLLPGGSAASR